MAWPCARARGHMGAGNHGNPHKARLAGAEAPMPQHTSRAPKDAQTARFRCCRIARVTAAPPARAATLLAPACRAQPPITAPIRDL
jgi:hypothetical protein